MHPTVLMYTRSAMRSMILASSRISLKQMEAMSQMHDSSCRALLKRCKKTREKKKSRETGAPRDGGWCLGSLHTEEAHLAELGRKQSKPHKQINGTASLFQLQSIFYPLFVHNTHTPRSSADSNTHYGPHSADSAGARKNKRREVKRERAGRGTVGINTTFVKKQ